MDPLMLAIAAVGLGALALRNKGPNVSTTSGNTQPQLTGGADPAAGGSLGVSFAAYGPNSDPRNWFQGVRPGTVIVQEQETAHFDGNGNLQMAQSAAGLTAIGAGAAGGLGIGSAGGIIGSSTFGSAGTIVGTAVPLIGIAVGLVATVLGIISAHHKAALAAEGKALNSADPRAIDRFAMVILAVLKGEITTAAAAETQVKQTITDYYNEVKSVERGKWPYTGKDLSIEYQKSGYVIGTGKARSLQGSDWHGPDPCNGACVVGHFFIERGGALVMATVKQIFAGTHGQVVFPEIPPHQTQSGFPAVQVVF